MKKLLAILLAALLLTAPLSLARAEGEEPPAEPPVQSAAPEATEPPTPATQEPTAAPAEDDPADAPDETPVETPVETPAPAEDPADQEEAAPTEAPASEAPDEPEETAAPDEPEETAAPESPAAEESPESPAADGEASEESDEAADDDDQETAPASQDHPLLIKSLEYWEQERQSIQLTGDLREDILIIARSQLGYSADQTFYREDEGRRHLYTRYGDWNGNPFINWCDCFVSFCIFYAGNDQYPQESSCYRHMLALKQAGYWREWNCYIPRKGDIVFFSFPEKYPMPTHVALVEEVLWDKDGQAGQLVTIEGNMPNPAGEAACVRRMVRSLKDVVGYGTYEAGKVYPAGCSYRSDGWQIIDRDSLYFVEHPVEEVLRFLGLENSQYYACWFPTGPETAPEPLVPKPTAPAKTTLAPKPPRLVKGQMKLCE